MRFLYLNIFLFLFVASSSAQWKSYKIYQGDTINRVDQQGRKQGLWIYFNDKYEGGIVQKGYYKDGKKEGEWIVYYPNGNIKTKSFYKNNRIYGPVITYYKNGKIREQGTWKGNKWVGEYRYYYENGQLKYLWYFNQSGKREGKQVYYYDNGQKYVEGTWSEGKENGQIKEYYPNGQLHKISNWKNGLQNGKYVEYYDTGDLMMKKYYIAGKEDSTKTKYYAYVAKVDVSKQKVDSPRVFKQFSGSGFFRFYNADGKLISEGEFKGGVLYNGKKYFYDKEGNLVKTAYIEEGRVTKIETVKKDETEKENN